MSKLVAQSPWAGLERELDGLKLREITGLEILSIAIPNTHKSTFEKQSGITLPTAGLWRTHNSERVLWTGQNQYFLFSDSENERLDEQWTERLGEIAYFTLQTDGWAVLEVSGQYVHQVLERFIPLDLEAEPVGFGSRTSAHHMSVIVLKTGDTEYSLLTPRSSSGTFLEALETVIEHVVA